MTKTVPISVRVSNEDAEFIANLQIDNAVTPSDKVRSLIKEAKQQKERVVSYEGCLNIARETLKDLVQKVKSIESKEKQHSELVNVFNEWVTECFAYVASAKYEIQEDQIKLKQLEEGISERVFRLFEAVARMGVTSQEPCYNKKIILTGFLPTLELIQIINQRIEKEK
jgi:predicted  nucleic acid-binding Zn-ribbon protein